MIELNLSSGGLLELQPAVARKFKGLKIPGSELLSVTRKDISIHLHVFQHPLFQIILQEVNCTASTELVIKEENQWLRIEVVLQGQLCINLPNEDSVVILPGQYHFSDCPLYGLTYQSDQRTLYFTVLYSPELLQTAGFSEPLRRSKPAPASQEMLDLIYELLKNPFQEGFRQFYYANRVRELLFFHVVKRPVTLFGELSPHVIAQMHEADQIMSNNLDGNITIPELAKILGTNFVTLKRNYEKVFGIGIFPRLMQRKMEHIQLLLEKTEKPLKEIADLAGYQTLPGFINAFRKRFKVTPKEWRNAKRDK